MPSLTLNEARDRYLGSTAFKSAHTLASYRRSIDMFIECLDMLQGGLPVLEHRAHGAANLTLDRFTAGDAPIFQYFAVWLKARGLAHSSILTRLAGVQSWLRFCDNHEWLPHFNLTKACAILSAETRQVRAGLSGQAPEPPADIELAIYYYDTLQAPGFKDERAAQRWELTRLRNRALMHALAETGGRVSEVLSLNMPDFPTRCFRAGEVLRVPVGGKGGYHDLRLLESLPPIRVYIEARGIDSVAVRQRAPLFVVHSPTPSRDGRRMTRHNAAYVVRKAARALGLKHITPHQFRHWRASQLVNAGVDLDVVQDFLGHKSIETTRRFYARTDARRIDAAAQQVGLPRPEGKTKLCTPTENRIRKRSC